MLARPSSARVVLRGAFLRGALPHVRGAASGLLPSVAVAPVHSTATKMASSRASLRGFSSLRSGSRSTSAATSTTAAPAAPPRVPLPLPASAFSTSSSASRPTPASAGSAAGLTSESALAKAASLFGNRLTLSPRALSLLIPLPRAHHHAHYGPHALPAGDGAAAGALKLMIERQVYTSSSFSGMLLLLVAATVVLTACRVAYASGPDAAVPEKPKKAPPPPLVQYETGAPAPPAREATSDRARAARAEAKRRGALEEERFNRLIKTNRARRDPFGATYDPNPMTPYEWAKLIFNYTLFPIGWVRAGIVTALFATSCLLAKLSIAGLDIGPHNNYGMAVPPQREGWRAAAKGAIPYVIRAALYVAGFHSLTINGEKADALDAPIVVSNHVSLLDAVILFMLYDGPSFISKASIDKVPVLNWPLRACGAILVDRSSPTSRADCSFEIRRRAAVNAEAATIRTLTGKAPPAYPPLLVFPEGTTTTGDTLVRFKHGAFNPMVPVQPVVLRYPHKYFNPTDAGTSKGNPWFVPRLLGQFENKAEVTYLPVMKPRSHEDATQYAERVRLAMADALQVLPSFVLAY